MTTHTDEENQANEARLDEVDAFVRARMPAEDLVHRQVGRYLARAADVGERLDEEEDAAAQVEVEDTTIRLDAAEVKVVPHMTIERTDSLETMMAKARATQRADAQDGYAKSPEGGKNKKRAQFEKLMGLGTGERASDDETETSDEESPDDTDAEKKAKRVRRMKAAGKMISVNTRAPAPRHDAEDADAALELAKKTQAAWAATAGVTPSRRVEEEHHDAELPSLRDYDDPVGEARRRVAARGLR